MPKGPTRNEIAFYYPGHIWGHGEWIKNLLLFFDGVGLLVPEYKKMEAELLDPVLAGPLREQGLLHYLVADEVVDEGATQQLANVIAGLLEAGAMDPLAREDTAFHAISMSRMGFSGDARIAHDLFDRLKARRLARDSEDGVSIPVHPLVRYLILTLLSQILRPKGAQLGFDLFPATDQPQIVDGLTEFLNLPTVPSAGSVVAFDLNKVSIDLSSVPLDEVLAFKSEFGLEHRAYARAIREFTRQLSLMPSGERPGAFKDRQAQIDDLATDLRRRAKRSWKQPVVFGLGLAGAFWNFATGDPIGALLSGGAVAVAGLGERQNEAGAFSYLFSARRRYPAY